MSDVVGDANIENRSGISTESADPAAGAPVGTGPTPAPRRPSSFDDEDLRQIEAHHAYLARRKWLLIGIPVLLVVASFGLFRVMGRGSLVAQMSKVDVREAERLAADHPEDVEIQIAAGKREIDENLTAEAHDRMKRLAARYPKDRNVLAGLARTAAMTGSAHEAVDAYQKVLNLDPRSTTNLVMLAQIYTEAGLYSDAIVEFEKALAIDPHFLDKNPLYGRCLVEVGRYEDAMNQLTTVVTEMRMADNGFPPLAHAAIKLGRQFEVEAMIARRLYSTSLYYFGEVRHSYVLLALSQPHTPARLKDAETQARAAIGDQRSEYEWGLARVLQLEGKWREALEVAKKGVAREPAHRKCWQAIVDAADHLGDRETARQARAKVTELERPDREIKPLQDRIAASPDDRQAYLTLASALERLGRHAKAAEVIHKLLRKKGDDPEASALLAQYRTRAIDTLMLSTKDFSSTKAFYVPEE